MNILSAQNKQSRLSLVTGVLFVITLGMFFLYWAALLPRLTQLPKDFSYTARVDSIDNFFDSETKTFRGEQQSVTQFSYTTKSEEKGIALIENLFDVRSLKGEKIFSVKRLYGIDRTSGTHVHGSGDHDRDGYLFGPRMRGILSQVSDKSSYMYWHANYDVGAPMEFRSEEVLSGLPVYRYEANFVADQTKELSGVLPDVGTKKGIRLHIHLQIWIEPYTGSLVSYRDETTAAYYDLSTGNELEPWNAFSNSITPSSVAVTASRVTIEKEKILFLSELVPIVFVVILLCLLLVIFRQAWGIHALLDIINRSVYKSALIAGSVCIVLLVATGALYFFTVSAINQQIHAQFQSETALITETFLNRFQIYADILRGGAAFVNNTESLSRGKWQNYTKTLGLTDHYPGVQGLGFARTILPAQLASVSASIQSEGLPSFHVFPEENRSIYTSIIYLEPFDERNQRAVGYDMFTEQVRRSAMLYARTSGDVSLSGKVILLQENGIDPQPGFLMYMPVFFNTASRSASLSSIEDVRGFVYSPFRAHDFMRGTLLHTSSTIGIQVYDTKDLDQVQEKTLFFSTGVSREEGNLHLSVPLSFGGRTWTIHYTSPTDYGLDIFRRSIPAGLGVIGILLSFTMATIVYIISNSGKKAEQLVEEKTAQLRAQTEKLEQFNSQLTNEVAQRKDAEEELRKRSDVLQRMNDVMVGRELKMVELKKELETLRGGSSNGE